LLLENSGINNTTSSSLSSSDYASVYSGPSSCKHSAFDEITTLETNEQEESMNHPNCYEYNKFVEISPGRHKTHSRKSTHYDRKRKKHLIDDLDLNIIELEDNDFYYEQTCEADKHNLRTDLIAYSVPKFFETNSTKFNDHSTVYDDSDKTYQEDYLEHYKTVLTQSNNIDFKDYTPHLPPTTTTKYSSYNNRSNSTRSISSNTYNDQQMYKPIDNCYSQDHQEVVVEPKTSKNIYDNPIAKQTLHPNYHHPVHSLSQSYPKQGMMTAVTGAQVTSTVSSNANVVPYVQHRVIVSKSNKQRGELVLEYEC
jgi:hypothetical protein